ncbi:hypothetical protein [Candidatus Nitrotoga sp. HW29]|nr:hypothetical protein [Candidatus Nitrotoga sp. HW29]
MVVNITNQDVAANDVGNLEDLRPEVFVTILAEAARPQPGKLK